MQTLFPSRSIKVGIVFNVKLNKPKLQSKKKKKVYLLILMPKEVLPGWQ